MSILEFPINYEVFTVTVADNLINEKCDVNIKIK